MTPKALLAAAALLVVSLTPSVTDAAEAHEDKPQHRWLIYLWFALVVVIALAFGEVMMGSK